MVVDSVGKEIKLRQMEIAKLRTQQADLRRKQEQVQKLADLRERQSQEIKSLKKIKVPSIKQVERKRSVSRKLRKTKSGLISAEKGFVKGVKFLAREERKLERSPAFKSAVALFLGTKKAKRVR